MQKLHVKGYVHEKKEMILSLGGLQVKCRENEIRDHGRSHAERRVGSQVMPDHRTYSRERSDLDIIVAPLRRGRVQ